MMAWIKRGCWCSSWQRLGEVSTRAGECGLFSCCLFIGSDCSLCLNPASKMTFPFPPKHNTNVSGFFSVCSEFFPYLMYLGRGILFLLEVLLYGRCKSCSQYMFCFSFYLFFHQDCTGCVCGRAARALHPVSSATPTGCIWSVARCWMLELHINRTHGGLN